MSLWSLLGVAALVAASLPPTYFSLAVRRRQPAFSALSALLAAALLLHAAFHGAKTLYNASTEVLLLEVASAALILAFASTYWLLRGRR